VETRVIEELQNTFLCLEELERYVKDKFHSAEELVNVHLGRRTVLLVNVRINFWSTA